ncbi:MAG: Gfo/Idh/MocA family protein [Nitrososphaerales archaeon]
MRFLQLGLGSMGKRRVRCLQALRAGEIVAFDVRPDRRAEAEQLYGIATAATFEEGMAADPDAIIISTPPNQHVEYCLAAIGAGKPFFVEETVMLDPEALNPVLAALEVAAGGLAGPVVAAPSCTMRFHPAAKYIKAVLESGEVGRPLSFNATCLSYLPEWHPWERIEDFYVASRASGGGREMAIFDVDWLEGIFGNVKSVLAEVEKIAAFPADIDDTFHMLLRFANGLAGSFTVSVAFPVGGRSLELACEKGQIIWDSRIHKVSVYTLDDGKWKQYMETSSRDHSYDHMYIDEIEHFLRAVRGEVAYVRDMRDVKRLLEMLCAVERSAAEGRRIVLA